MAWTFDVAHIRRATTKMHLIDENANMYKMNVLMAESFMELHASNAGCYVFEQLGELNLTHMQWQSEMSESKKKKFDKLKAFCKIML